MEKIDYLPLGSMVIIKGSVRKAVVISRGLMTVIGDECKFFDYGGCLYPEGVVGDQILYFNHKDIAKVIHEGYRDEDDEMMVADINEWFEKSDVERGNPYELNQQNNERKT
jgi:hypothetical protein